MTASPELSGSIELLELIAPDYLRAHGLVPGKTLGDPPAGNLPLEVQVKVVSDSISLIERDRTKIEAELRRKLRRRTRGLIAGRIVVALGVTATPVLIALSLAKIVVLVTAVISAVATVLLVLREELHEKLPGSGAGVVELYTQYLDRIQHIENMKVVVEAARELKSDELRPVLQRYVLDVEKLNETCARLRAQID